MKRPAAPAEGTHAIAIRQKGGAKKQLGQARGSAEQSRITLTKAAWDVIDLLRGGADPGNAKELLQDAVGRA